jgi:glycosyltransferase involved in cell wall biosynthesis
VTHLGAKEVFRRALSQETIEAARQRFRLDGPYLLHVGRTDAWKNFDVLPQALGILNAGGRRIELVHAGPPHRWPVAREEADRRCIREVGVVSDEELAALYQGAVALVFPSVYEGFGIPVAEALASGCPVVTAAWGAMREVCGDAGLLVDTRDPQAIARAVERILAEPGLREDLIRRGRERSAALTWDATARRTLEVILEAAGVSAPAHD